VVAAKVNWAVMSCILAPTWSTRTAKIHGSKMQDETARPSNQQQIDKDLKLEPKVGTTGQVYKPNPNPG
jgi:hypothetical protein